MKKKSYCSKFIVIGPLSPFLAIWGAVQINFKDKPPVPLPIASDILLKAEEEIKLNTIAFYNIAIVGVSGTGKVKEKINAFSGSL